MNMDDLSAGMLVTIREWKPREVAQMWSLNSFASTTRTVQSREWVGDPLEVVQVELPFVVLRKVPGGRYDRPRSIDTREATLVRVSPAYVAALAHTALGETP